VNTAVGSTIDGRGSSTRGAGPYPRLVLLRRRLRRGSVRATMRAWIGLKVMTMRLEAFGGSPRVLERLIRGEDLSGDESGDEAAAALAALVRSLGFEKVTVVFEQPPAT
jgi:hypothetical protein